MADMTDGLSSAWKGAMRGMKTGYKYTKSALTTNPLDKLRSMGGTGGGVSHSSDIRRFFQLKYGAEVRTDDGHRVAAAEASDVESDTDEALTDEQVHERVDKKFFDKSYDAARFELGRMEVTYDESEEHSRAEREVAERLILEHRLKCDVVSTTLKRRVLAHHREFVSGIEGIKGVNDALFQTSSDCKKTRAAIRRSKTGVSSQIALLAQHRARANVRSTLTVLAAMDRMAWKRNQLLALVTGGKFVEARRLLKAEGPIDREAELMRVYSMKAVIHEWRAYRDSPERLRHSLDAVLTACLTVKFIPATYQNCLESSTVISDGPRTCGLVAQLLWNSAVQILTKSLIEVSYVKDDSASIADIADGIHADHLLLCFCQMAARLIDFFYLYVTIMRLHTEEVHASGSYATFAALHGTALQQVQSVGSKIGRDLVEKLSMALAHAQLDKVDMERVLHLFVVVSMLVEGMGVLGLSKAELASARTQVKGVLLAYVGRQFQAPKAKEALAFMAEDRWVVSDTSALSLTIVRPVAPAGYKACIREVKRYLALSGADGAADEEDANNTSSTNNRSGGGGELGVGSTAENPFYTTAMLIPQDTSSLIQTETFGHYWAALRDPGHGAAVAPAAEEPDDDAPGGVVLPGQQHHHQQQTPPRGRAGSVATATTTVLDGSNTLAGLAMIPPTVLTSSAISIANVFVEYVARVAVRFPPLAADILNWCEDIIGLYMYTVADNFVSISKNVPVEQQTDFTPQTQGMLVEMRAAGERAVMASNGVYRPPAARGGSAAVMGGSPGKSSSSGASALSPSSTDLRFPPRVWGAARAEFGSEPHQYALASRALACEACTTLIFLQEAVVRSFTPLLPPAIVAEHLARVRVLYTTAVEVLNVCVHRLCQAIYPMEATCNEIGKLKPNKDEVKVSGYVKGIVAGMVALNERRQPMPTPILETLFLQRLIFSVQAALVREYAKLTKKKLNDIFVMQLQVDTQNFQQQAAAAFGRENVVLPDHVLGLVKTGFYMDDKAQRLAWVRQHHANYQAADLLSWFASGDKTFKAQLEDLLGRELRHHDTIPVDRFVQEL